MLVSAARAASAVSAFLGKACSPLYAACILLSAFEVFMRYVAGSPTQWTFEVVMVLCASAWLLSAGYVTQRHAHIAITSFTLLMPWRMRHLLALGGDLVGALALTILAYASIDPAHMAVQSMEKSGSAFNSPMPVYLKVMLVAAAAFTALQMLANFVLAVRQGTVAAAGSERYGD